MLISVDYSGKKNSAFVCDRCEAQITGEERIALRAFRSKQQTIIKKWDLCPLCYKKLCRGIEKYKEKTE